MGGCCCFCLQYCKTQYGWRIYFGKVQGPEGAGRSSVPCPQHCHATESQILLLALSLLGYFACCESLNKMPAQGLGCRGSDRHSAEVPPHVQSEIMKTKLLLSGLFIKQAGQINFSYSEWSRLWIHSSPFLWGPCLWLIPGSHSGASSPQAGSDEPFKARNGLAEASEGSLRGLSLVHPQQFVSIKQRPAQKSPL